MKKLFTLSTIFVVLLLAVSVFAQEEYDEQMKAYQQQMLLYRAGTAYNQGKELYNQKKFEGAIEQFNACTAKLDSLETMTPKAQALYSQTLLLLGDSYNKTENYVEAAKTFGEVPNYDAKNIDAMYYSMLAYTKADSLEKAIEVGNKIIETDPTYVKVYPALGNAYKSQEEYEKAAEIYQKGIELEPENVTVMFPLAALFETEKKYSDASDIYVKILGLEPENDKALYFYGVALEKLGQDAKAIAQLKKVKSDSDYGQKAKDYIDYINKKSQGGN